MKAETLLVFFVAAIFLHQSTVSGFNQNRILNGTATPIGVFEFLSSILAVIPKRNSITVSSCSSTIISNRHILTAAHCIYAENPTFLPNGNLLLHMRHTEAFLVDYRPKNKVIVVDADEPGKKKGLFYLKDYSIQPKIYVHPSYDTVQLQKYDIAIIEFPEDTQLGITPVTLISDFIEKDGEKAIAAGYGAYKEGTDSNGLPYQKFPDVLQNVTVDLHSPEKCIDTQGIAPTIICTGTADYRAAQGDSGGPLMIEKNGNYYQVGVLSAGLLNNAIYTRLSMTCNWISKITKGAVNCQPLSSIPPPKPAPPNQPTEQPIQPNDKGTTKSNTDVTEAPAPPGPYDETDAPAQPANTEAQQLPSNANISFIFNILFLFICIFFFA